MYIMYIELLLQCELSLDCDSLQLIMMIRIEFSYQGSLNNLSVYLSVGELPPYWWDEPSDGLV